VTGPGERKGKLVGRGAFFSCHGKRNSKEPEDHPSESPRPRNPKGDRFGGGRVTWRLRAGGAWSQKGGGGGLENVCRIVNYRTKKALWLEGFLLAARKKTLTEKNKILTVGRVGKTKTLIINLSFVQEGKERHRRVWFSDDGKVDRGF